MRKKSAEKRRVIKDPKYRDALVTKLINNMMQQGKKNVARRIVYGSFDVIHERTDKDPLDVYRKALKNVAPVTEVRSRRVGGATYQVPVEVRQDRQVTLAVRWIKRYARARREKTMAERLASELIAAYNGEGASVKKREDTHRMAESNKAFAHFKW